MTRERLANRRASEVFELELNGLKPGSTSDCYARDAAIAASLALQHNCPLQTPRHALLRDPQGRPQTPLGAALDILARDSTP
jgi:hypothetical protein